MFGSPTNINRMEFTVMNDSLSHCGCIITFYLQAFFFLYQFPSHYEPDAHAEYLEDKNLKQIAVNYCVKENIHQECGINSSRQY